MSPFEAIDKFKAKMSVRRLCDSFGVSPSSYYAWRKYEPSKRALDDAQLTAKVRAIYHEHNGRYGSPRVFKELKTRGEKVSRKRVERLMRQHGIRGTFRRRFRRTTDSQHKHPVAPNLLERNFKVNAPNRVWVGDITYVWTNEGWSYLAVLIDLYSRKVIGWALSNRLTRDLALRALRMALVTRQPPAGLIHHTDRGCQYASHEYRQVLANAGIRQSMSRVGDCWDNAVSESFFASIKKELIHRESYATRTEAYDAISEYIDNYFNARRRHSAIGYAIPNQLEREATQLAA